MIIKLNMNKKLNFIMKQFGIIITRKTTTKEVEMKIKKENQTAEVFLFSLLSRWYQPPM